MIPVIAIFDVGRTNKKLLLFDEHYQLVYEKQIHLDEIKDEDGFPCEDITALVAWIKDSLTGSWQKEFHLQAVNFSSFGASFVHLGEHGKILTPLYNYLKPFPDFLRNKFYSDYGGAGDFSNATASPVLGNLNSGMQLYRIKYEQPTLFEKIELSLHLPQYLSYALTGKAYSEMTSIGCHTNLWDFGRRRYHRWVSAEGMETKLPPLRKASDAIHAMSDEYPVPAGIGLHDSSAALIPYLSTFQEPFLLISTGTWSISLNPFNTTSLSEDELKNDCLCYLTYDGKQVKAARIFLGHYHDEQAGVMAAHFNVNANAYKDIGYQPNIIEKLRRFRNPEGGAVPTPINLELCKSYEEAYHHLMLNLIALQAASTQRVLTNSDVRRIFVDGGFSTNTVYMNLLAAAFPGLDVRAAQAPYASALGAALVIHDHWNKETRPDNLVRLKSYHQG